MKAVSLGLGLAIAFFVSQYQHVVDTSVERLNHNLIIIHYHKKVYQVYKLDCIVITLINNIIMILIIVNKNIIMIIKNKILILIMVKLMITYRTQWMVYEACMEPKNMFCRKLWQLVPFSQVFFIIINTCLCHLTRS